MTDYLRDRGFDFDDPDGGSYFDELPLWSAPFGQLLLERVPLVRGATMVDLGAGTGFLSIELAQRCGVDSSVIAVDTWGAAVRRLREKVARLGLTNVRVVQADAAALELDDASVDLVVSNLGINNFENPFAVLKSAHRVARPGAVLSIATNVVGHMQELYELFTEVLERESPSYDEEALKRHVDHRMRPESLVALVASAGFEVEETARSSFQMRFADGSAMLRHYLVRVGFLPAWKALVASDQREQVFAALERRLNDAAKRRGDLSLTIPMLYVEARR